MRFQCSSFLPGATETVGTVRVQISVWLPALCNVLPHTVKIRRDDLLELQLNYLAIFRSVFIATLLLVCVCRYVTRYSACRDSRQLSAVGLMLHLEARIPRRRHRHPCRHPREDRREDVGVIVGVGVVECGLISGRENVT